MAALDVPAPSCFQQQRPEETGATQGGQWGLSDTKPSQVLEKQRPSMQKEWKGPAHISSSGLTPGSVAWEPPAPLPGVQGIKVWKQHSATKPCCVTPLAGPLHHSLNSRVQETSSTGQIFVPVEPHLMSRGFLWNHLSSCDFRQCANTAVAHFTQEQPTLSLLCPDWVSKIDTSFLSPSGYPGLA